MTTLLLKMILDKKNRKKINKLTLWLLKAVKYELPDVESTTKMKRRNLSLSNFVLKKNSSLFLNKPKKQKYNFVPFQNTLKNPNLKISKIIKGFLKKNTNFFLDLAKKQKTLINLIQQKQFNNMSDFFCYFFVSIKSFIKTEKRLKRKRGKKEYFLKPLVFGKVKSQYFYTVKNFFNPKFNFFDSKKIKNNQKRFLFFNYNLFGLNQIKFLKNLNHNKVTFSNTRFFKKSFKKPITKKKKNIKTLKTTIIKNKLKKYSKQLNLKNKKKTILLKRLYKLYKKNLTSKLIHMSTTSLVLYYMIKNTLISNTIITFFYTMTSKLQKVRKLTILNNAIKKNNMARYSTLIILAPKIFEESGRYALWVNLPIKIINITWWIICKLSLVAAFLLKKAIFKVLPVLLIFYTYLKYFKTDRTVQKKIEPFFGFFFGKAGGEQKAKKLTEYIEINAEKTTKQITEFWTSKEKKLIIFNFFKNIKTWLQKKENLIDHWKWFLIPCLFPIYYLIKIILYIYSNFINPFLKYLIISITELYPKIIIKFTDLLLYLKTKLLNDLNYLIFNLKYKTSVICKLFNIIDLSKPENQKLFLKHLQTETKLKLQKVKNFEWSFDNILKVKDLTLTKCISLKEKSLSISIELKIWLIELKDWLNTTTLIVIKDVTHWINKIQTEEFWNNYINEKLIKWKIDNSKIYTTFLQKHLENIPVKHDGSLKELKDIKNPLSFHIFENAQKLENSLNSISEYVSWETERPFHNTRKLKENYYYYKLFNEPDLLQWMCDHVYAKQVVYQIRTDTWFDEDLQQEFTDPNYKEYWNWYEMPYWKQAVSEKAKMFKKDHDYYAKIIKMEELRDENIYKLIPFKDMWTKYQIFLANKDTLLKSGIISKKSIKNYNYPSPFINNFMEDIQLFKQLDGTICNKYAFPNENFIELKMECKPPKITKGIFDNRGTTKLNIPFAPETDYYHEDFRRPVNIYYGTSNKVFAYYPKIKEPKFSESLDFFIKYLDTYWKTSESTNSSLTHWDHTKLEILKSWYLYKLTKTYNCFDLDKPKIKQLGDKMVDMYSVNEISRGIRFKLPDFDMYRPHHVFDKKNDIWFFRFTGKWIKTDYDDLRITDSGYWFDSSKFKNKSAWINQFENHLNFYNDKFQERPDIYYDNAIILMQKLKKHIHHSNYCRGESEIYKGLIGTANHNQLNKVKNYIYTYFFEWMFKETDKTIRELHACGWIPNFFTYIRQAKKDSEMFKQYEILENTIYNLMTADVYNLTTSTPQRELLEAKVKQLCELYMEVCVIHTVHHALYHIIIPIIFFKIVMPIFFFCSFCFYFVVGINQDSLEPLRDNPMREIPKLLKTKRILWIDNTILSFIAFLKKKYKKWFMPRFNRYVVQTASNLNNWRKEYLNSNVIGNFFGYFLGRWLHKEGIAKKLSYEKSKSAIGQRKAFRRCRQLIQKKLQKRLDSYDKKTELIPIKKYEFSGRLLKYIETLKNVKIKKQFHNSVPVLESKRVNIDKLEECIVKHWNNLYWTRWGKEKISFWFDRQWKSDLWRYQWTAFGKPVYNAIKKLYYCFFKQRPVKRRMSDIGELKEKHLFSFQNYSVRNIYGTALRSKYVITYRNDPHTVIDRAKDHICSLQTKLPTEEVKRVSRVELHHYEKKTGKTINLPKGVNWHGTIYPDIWVGYDNIRIPKGTDRFGKKVYLVPSFGVNPFFCKISKQQEKLRNENFNPAKIKRTFQNYRDALTEYATSLAITIDKLDDDYAMAIKVTKNVLSEHNLTPSIDKGLLNFLKELIINPWKFLQVLAKIELQENDVNGRWKKQNDVFETNCQRILNLWFFRNRNLGTPKELQKTGIFYLFIILEHSFLRKVYSGCLEEITILTKEISTYQNKWQKDYVRDVNELKHRLDFCYAIDNKYENKILPYWQKVTWYTGKNMLFPWSGVPVLKFCEAYKNLMKYKVAKGFALEIMHDSNFMIKSYSDFEHSYRKNKDFYSVTPHRYKEGKFQDFLFDFNREINAASGQHYQPWERIETEADILPVIRYWQHWLYIWLWRSEVLREEVFIPNWLLIFLCDKPVSMWRHFWNVFHEGEIKHDMRYKNTNQVFKRLNYQLVFIEGALEIYLVWKNIHGNTYNGNTSPYSLFWSFAIQNRNQYKFARGFVQFLTWYNFWHVLIFKRPLRYCDWFFNLFKPFHRTLIILKELKHSIFGNAITKIYFMARPILRQRWKDGVTIVQKIWHTRILKTKDWYDYLNMAVAFHIFVIFCAFGFVNSTSRDLSTAYFFFFCAYSWVCWFTYYFAWLSVTQWPWMVRYFLWYVWLKQFFILGYGALPDEIFVTIDTLKAVWYWTPDYLRYGCNSIYNVNFWRVEHINFFLDYIQTDKQISINKILREWEQTIEFDLIERRKQNLNS